MDLQFRLKTIQFFNRSTVIICQNENGPCPLIAIANILLLRGILNISTDRSYVSLDEVNQYVADALIEESTKRLSGANEVRNEVLGNNLTGNEILPDGIIPNHEEINHHIQDVLSILPKLSNGLDLNVHFNGVNKYEFTQEITIFDALNIPLVHGWLYDESNDPELSSIIGNKSYNLLLNDLVEYLSLKEKLYHNTSSHITSLPIDNDRCTAPAPVVLISPTSPLPPNEEVVISPGSVTTQTTSGCSDQTQDTANESLGVDQPIDEVAGTLGESVEPMLNSGPTNVYVDQYIANDNRVPIEVIVENKMYESPVDETSASVSPVPLRTVDNIQIQREEHDTLQLNAEETRLLRDGPKIDDFLTRTASQLTEKGIFRLYDFMNDRQLAVFFRNNHFSTLFAYNGQLFLLLTDVGFCDQAAVWELLVSVDGETEFFNDQFIAISEHPHVPEGSINRGVEYLPNPDLGPMVHGTVCLPPSAPLTLNPAPSKVTNVSTSTVTSPIVAISQAPSVTEAPSCFSVETGDCTISSPLHDSSVRPIAVIMPPSSILANGTNTTNEYGVVGEAKVISPVSFVNVPNGSQSTTKQMFTDSHASNSFVTVDEDADLQFALQLQRELDREAELAAVHNSSLPETNREEQRYPSNQPPMSRNQYTPYQSDSLVSDQLDLDQQMALELHYQEMKAAENAQRPVAANRPQGSNRPVHHTTQHRRAGNSSNNTQSSASQCNIQ